MSSRLLLALMNFFHYGGMEEIVESHVYISLILHKRYKFPA